MNGSQYTVHLTTAAQRDLTSLMTSRDMVVAALLELESDPTAGYILKGSLRQARSLHFRVRGVDC